MSLRFRVERAMPVRGETVRLTAWVVAGRATVQFFARGPDGLEREVCPAQRVRAGGRGPRAVEAEWTPDEAGPWTVLCLVTGRGMRMSAIREAWVTARPLHFVYWGCPPTQRHVTAVMVSEKEPQAARRWRNRGVAALRWRGGQCYREKRKAPDDYATPWGDTPPGFSGILIDEFGAGNEADQVMGRALVQTRRRRPSMVIAPYCVGLDGEDMLAGFREADVILPECYCPDWRYYGLFRRWRDVAQHGLAAKTVVALGIGRQWATTEAEIRRQVAYLRTTYPEMPGISFFPGVPPRLSEAVDRAIEDFFLRPAILLRWEAGDPTAEVRNIGQLPAEDVVVVYEGQRVSRRTIPQLAAGARLQLQPPDGTALVSVGREPSRYSVVSYEPPTSRPVPESEAQARLALARLRSGPSARLFASVPTLDIVRSEDKQGRAELTGNIEAATLPLGEYAGRVRGLEVDVEVGRCWFYGRIGLELTGGDASFGFSLCHHEPDDDIPKTSPRLTAWLQDAGKDRIHNTMPPGLEPGRVYRVVLAREEKGARVLVWEKGGRLVWDGGPWRTSGIASFDTLRFSVRPFRDSAIEWDGKTRRLFLRGVSPGPVPSPYRLEGWLSDPVLYVTGKGPTE